MPKQFLITAKHKLEAEGFKLGADDEIAVITTDLPLMTLLGMLQFHHAKAIELKDEELPELATAESKQDSESDDFSESGAQSDSPEGDVEGDKGDDSEADSDDSGKPDEDQESEEIRLQVEACKAFTDDGLDEKIANVLAEQGLTPDAIRAKIGEGFDLEELEDIGLARADKIKAIYGS